MIRFLSPTAGRAGIIAMAALLITACEGPQSALDPAGPHARYLADLFWVMAVGSGIIWLVVAAITVFVLVRSHGHPEVWSRVLIWGGGIILPVAVLSVLLPFGFWVMADLRAEPSTAPIRIGVTGHLWWWEIHYDAPELGGVVESANEIRIPVGEPVEFVLESPGVIHSFWVPALGGKMDLIPGRTNTLVLEADRPGIYRGQCAEFCGASHAHMSFYVVAMERGEFDAWLAREAAPYRPSLPALDAEGTNLPFAPVPAQAAEEPEGLALFLEAGCGACHTIRGTPADGELGPDLTHVGSRLSIGAGILPNNVGTLAGWIANAQALKPDNQMPSFNTLPGEELRAIAHFLSELE